MKMANRVPIIVLVSLLVSSLFAASVGNFLRDVDITWGNGRGKMLHGGNLVSLSMDQSSGSGFQSKRDYLFGRFDVQMKLVPGNAAGTVTTFYLSSQGKFHDEIDLEFLGNATGQPYTLHTNIYIQGQGSREQEFRLWFDPANKFHTYSIVWNPQRIIILVDNIPIRVFNNLGSKGVPYADKQPMKLYATLWNGEQWATQGGKVKTDWSKAPFTVYYRNFNAQTTDSPGDKGWLTQDLDAQGRRLLRRTKKRYMIYNYCTDPRPRRRHPECWNTRLP